METVKKKWRMLKTYRRARTLWNEYKEVAQIDDFTLVTTKLTEFLDFFVDAYKEASADSTQSIKIDLDKIYGDCSQILLNLVDLVEREAEKTSASSESIIADLINKALNVAELILHDEKYRLIVKETPNLINRILSLLDSLKTVENKKLLLRVISILGETTANQLEIGRQEGFRKIVKLLFAEDKELTREILQTLKHFLDVQSLTSNPSDEKSNRSSDYFTGRVKTVLSDVTHLLSSFFPSNLAKSSEGEYDSEYDPHQENSFIPSEEQISNAISELENRQVQLEDSETQDSQVEDHSHVEELVKKNTEDEILKDFMRVQGTLTALTTTLQEAALTVQLDLVETISKLIFKNQENQHEFKKINGYSFFLKLFDKISDFSSKEAQLFLDDCFSLFFTITLDGSAKKRVGNLDALELLLRMVPSAKQIPLRLHALGCLQDIVSSNPINVVDIRHMGGIDLLLQQQIRSPPTMTSEEIELSTLVNDFLNYVAVLLSHHNCEILTQYTQIISRSILSKKFDETTSSWVEDQPLDLAFNLKHLILGSIVKLVSDSIYHRTKIPANLMEISLTILDEFSRRFQNHKADESPEEIVEQVMLVLEIVGLLNKADASHLQSFSRNKGSEIVAHLISQNVPKEVAQLSLWILRELVLLEIRENSTCESAQIFIDVAKRDGITQIVQEELWITIFELAKKHNYTENKDRILKNFFREHDGLNISISMLKNPGSHNSSVILAVVNALGELITDSEENKDWIGETIGYLAFGSILKLSKVEIRTTQAETMLELATTNGSFRYPAVDRIGESEYQGNFGKISPIICNILAPQALHAEARTCSRNPLDNLSLSSLSLSLKEGLKNSNGENGSNSASSSRRSSFSDDGTLPIEAHEVEEEITVTKQVDDSQQSMASSMKISIDFPGISPKHLSAVGASYSHVGKLGFRNPESALMVIDLIPCCDISTQIYLLNFILKILENPKNKEIMHAAQGIKFILNLALQVEESVQSYYFKLISSLGTYRISRAEAKLLFDVAFTISHNTKDRDLQMQALFCIGTIAERKTPRKFFHFDGFTGFLETRNIERFPSNRTGYTFSSWVKVDYFLYPEVGLFSWEGDGKRPLFEAYFKKIQNSEGLFKYCLCVQTQNFPSPPEIHVFDSYTFVEEAHTWHHLVLTHSRQQVHLYVDGELSHTCNLSYPSSKDRVIQGTIGKRGSHGYFCGEIGSLHFFEGVWDEATSCRVFSKGSMMVPPFPKSMGIGNSEFLNVNPANFVELEIPVETPVVGVLGNLLGTTPTESHVSDGSQMSSGVSVHVTETLKDIISEVGGIQNCFPFLVMGSAQQVAGMRILTGLIQMSESTMKGFLEMNGWNILFNLLTLRPNLITTETLDVLFELICDGVQLRSKKRLVKHREGLLVIFDLVPYCDSQLQEHLLQGLTELIVSNLENLTLLNSMREGGINPISLVLGLFNNLKTDDEPVLKLVKLMSSAFNADDLEVVTDWISTDRDKLVPYKTAVLGILFEQIQNAIIPLEYLNKIGGYQTVFCILESPYEDIRVLGIKMLGLLLYGNPRNQQLLRTTAFEVLFLLIAPFGLSPAIISTLLELAMGSYLIIGEKKTTGWMNINLFSYEQNKNKNKKATLVHPECVHVLLEMLKVWDDIESQMSILIDIDRILIPENMEMLFESNWLDWILEFLQAYTSKPHRSEDASRINMHLNRIMEKMMVFDISRRNSQVAKFGELIEFEPFQVQVMESVVDHYDRNPTFNAENASDVISNIAIFYKYAEEVDLPAETCKKMIDNIDTLACQNSSATRALMKSKGLFDLRDVLIIRLLRGSRDLEASDADANPNPAIASPSTPSMSSHLTSSTSGGGNYQLSELPEVLEVRENFILNFPFESIANQKAFRDTNSGVLCLLQLFHEYREVDLQVQMTLYDILLGVFAPIEENRRIIASALEDPEVQSRFFQTEKEKSEISFVEWYNLAENSGKIQEIEIRISKLLQPPETKFQNMFKSMAQKKAKKIKGRKDRTQKSATVMNRAIAEFEEKRKQRYIKSQMSSAAREDLMIRIARDRARIGEESWKSLESKFAMGFENLMDAKESDDLNFGEMHSNHEFYKESTMSKIDVDAIAATSIPQEL